MDSHIRIFVGTSVRLSQSLSGQVLLNSLSDFPNDQYQTYILINLVNFHTVIAL